MKRQTSVGLAGFALIMVLVPCVQAVPMGTGDEGRGYLGSAEELGAWSAGVFAESREREVSIDGRDGSMKDRRTMLYLGRDALRWITPYLTVGSSEAEFGRFGSGGNNAAFGAGARFRLLHHDILDPTLLESLIKLDGVLQLTHTKGEKGAASLEWGEMQASLILSLVNDLEGSKFYVPYSIGLYVGPVYSDFLYGDLEGGDTLGYTAGIEVFVAKRVSINVGVESFDATGFAGGLHVRF